MEIQLDEEELNLKTFKKKLKKLREKYSLV